MAGRKEEFIMYHNKMVVSLKLGGRFLRDDNGEVKLPFGSEYGIYLKNLESRLATVKVSIDGEDVLDGNELVVYPNNPLELKGFMRHSTVVNRFKFIEKTKKIEEYRGNKPDDGLIRVEFRYLRERIEYPVITYNYHPYWVWIPYSGAYIYPGTYTDNNSATTFNPNLSSWTTLNCSGRSGLSFTSQENQGEGITVKGGEAYQSFQGVSVGGMEGKAHVMVLRLRGYRDEEKIRQLSDVAVKERKTCSICGEKNKYGAKYCRNCEAFLE